jgi:hypothetical protein
VVSSFSSSQLLSFLPVPAFFKADIHPDIKKFTGIIPTDADVDKAITDYVMEKHNGPDFKQSPVPAVRSKEFLELF